MTRRQSSTSLFLLPVLLVCTRSPHPPTMEARMETVPAQSGIAGATASTPDRMQTQVTGSGDPVVLIGGGLTGWRSWGPHAERLSTTRRVARLQLISVQYGLEGRPLRAGYGVRTESDALRAALDDLGWTDPLDLVAWSYGALVTLDFALAHPDRVRSLTLIEPPAIWVLADPPLDDPDLKELLELGRSLEDDVSEADLERFIRAVALAPPGIAPRELPQWPVWMEHRHSLLNTTAPFEHRDDPERLKSFDLPVLLVTGTGTSRFLRRIHDTLAATLPRARTAEMPAGHAPQLVSMERFLEELARFHTDAAR
jgi:pimeloyl-ACP methyl ester carboxylesterase